MLLVLAMLSILFLIGVALSYTTRLEGQASANFADQLQAKHAAISGLPTALPMIAAASQGVTSTLQPWYTATSEWNELVRSGSSDVSRTALHTEKSGDSTNTKLKAEDMAGAPQVLFSVVDLSGRLNLNSIPSEQALARVLKTVLPQGKNAEARARQLFQARGGDKVSSAPERMDLRRESGSQRLENLSVLSATKGTRADAGAFSDEELRTLQSYFTVFSESPELMNREDGTAVPKLPLQDLKPMAIYDALKIAFPDKDEHLLLQFAANVADYTDADDIPTVLTPDGQPPVGSNIIFGVEQTPFITEVYPDSVTPVTGGDTGQYVEISNPWSKNLVLAGWRLRTSGGSNVDLNVVLPPGGTVIITDNYETPAQSAAAGTGSFLSIFGARKDDNSKKLIESQGFDLEDRGGNVALYNPLGMMVDSFTYGNSGSSDSRQSFQRQDPRVRSNRKAEATPFAPASGADAGKMKTAQEHWKQGNQGLVNVTDLFRVSTAYVPRSSSNGDNGATQAAYPWQFPTLQAATSEDAARTNLDVRLIDAFTAVPVDPETTSPMELEDDKADPKLDQSVRYQPVRSYAYLQRAADAEGEQPVPDEETTGPAVAFAYGKLNLNTCAKTALLGLDLQGTGAGLISEDLVEKFEAYRLRKISNKKTPFLNVSDFVQEFLPNLSDTDLPALEQLLNQVTVGSSAFEIVAENRLSPDEMGDAKNGTASDRASRRAAISRAKWVIALDRQPYSLVSFATSP